MSGVYKYVLDDEKWVAKTKKEYFKYISKNKVGWSEREPADHEATAEYKRSIKAKTPPRSKK